MQVICVKKRIGSRTTRSAVAPDELPGAGAPGWDTIVANASRRGTPAVVNPYGCRSSEARDQPGHRLALSNLISNTSNAAIIVWKGNSAPTAGIRWITVAPEMDSGTRL